MLIDKRVPSWLQGFVRKVPMQMCWGACGRKEKVLGPNGNKPEPLYPGARFAPLGVSRA